MSCKRCEMGEEKGMRPTGYPGLLSYSQGFPVDPGGTATLVYETCALCSRFPFQTFRTLAEALIALGFSRLQVKQATAAMVAVKRLDTVTATWSLQQIATDLGLVGFEYVRASVSNDTLALTFERTTERTHERPDLKLTATREISIDEED